MWLLDTATISLHLILSTPIRPYAILSHTWGTSEVTLQDLQAIPPKNQDSAGYKKILLSCAQARLDGFKYIWIDTCCIDKTNSAELSEAINSMFEWYRNAVQCYAYLSDTSAIQEVKSSRWFTRGWTLQELLAPLSVIFFNKDWEELGTKASLAKEISAVTGIPRLVLLTNAKGEFSVAQIMSWAARRETTREEDMAYSLLGLFGVNMPMIYGEGKKAFRRLQLEIMKTSEDQSIFAWVGEGRERGPLAISPAEFQYSGDVQRVQVDVQSTEEYAMTNRGIRIKLGLTGPCDLSPQGQVFVAFLDCRLKDGRPVGIYLRQKLPGQYFRTRCGQLVVDMKNIPKKAKTKHQALYLMEPYSTSFNVSQWMRTPMGLYVFEVTYKSVLEYGFVPFERSTSSSYAVWTVNEGILGLKLEIDGSGQEGDLVFRNAESGERFGVTLGIHNHQVWSDIKNGTTDDPWTMDAKDLEEFDKQQDHPAPTRKNLARWQGLDRATCRLESNLFADVAIRNTLVHGKKQFLASITISAPWTSPRPLSTRTAGHISTNIDPVVEESYDHAKSRKLKK